MPTPVTVNIRDADITSARFRTQSGDEAAPASGFIRLYHKADGLYITDNNGYVIGPFSQKNNLGASLSPTVNDDDSSGYQKNSIWIDTTNGEIWRLHDETTGAADWREVVDIFTSTTYPKSESSMPLWDAANSRWIANTANFDNYERTGFIGETLNQSVLDGDSFDESTRTFTLRLAPLQTYFDWYYRNKRFVATGDKSIVIADTEGIHYIYLDENGDLDEIVGGGRASELVVFGQRPLVTIIAWDKDNQVATILTEERHGAQMSGATHYHIHQETGTLYIEGLALGNFDLDASPVTDTASQFSCDNGVILDEDLITTILNGFPQTLSPIISLPVFYKDGAAGYWRVEWVTDLWAATTAYSLGDRIIADNSYWQVTTAGTSGGVEPTWSTAPYPGNSTAIDGTVIWTNVGTPRSATKTFVGGNYLAAWNEYTGGIWTQTEVGNNNYVLAHIYATNDVRYPVIAVQGQTVHSTFPAAQASADTEINDITTAGLPFVEFRPIGSVIYQTGSYSNESKARIRDNDGAGYVDFRTTGQSPGQAASAHPNFSSLEWSGAGHTAITGDTFAAFNSSGVAELISKDDYVESAGDEMSGTLQVNVPTTTDEAIVTKSTDDNATNPLYKQLSSTDAHTFSILPDGTIVRNATGTIPNVGLIGVAGYFFTPSTIDFAIDSPADTAFSFLKSNSVKWRLRNDNTGSGEDDSFIFAAGVVFPVVLSLLPSGKVGVNTDSPTAAHHVVGNADIVQSKITANSTQTSSLAEWVGNTGTATIEDDGFMVTPSSAPTSDYQVANKKYVDDNGGSGEANTASNVGTAGVGVFKQKTGVDLEFKKINAGSSKITITDDVGNDEVDIDVAESNLTLDNIGGTLSISKGGSGQTTQQAAIDALTNVSAATNEYVLTKDTATGNAIFKVATGGGGGMTSFDLDGDTGTPQTITDGDTVSIDGGNGISTVVGATNTVTVSSSPTTQAGTPSGTPTFVGELDIDTTNDRSFVATDTSANTDWKRVDGSRVKLLEGTETSDAASISISGWPTDNNDYKEFILKVKGLRTDRAATYLDNVLVQFNSDSTAANYNTQRFDIVNTSANGSTFVGNQSGLFLRGVCSAATADSNVWGEFELHIKMPEDSSDWTQTWFIGGMASTTAGENLLGIGKSVWENAAAITSIEFLPGTGTTFLIGDAGEPNTLEWQLYGEY